MVQSVPVVRSVPAVALVLAARLAHAVALVLAAWLVRAVPAALFALGTPRVLVVRGLPADRSLLVVPAVPAATPRSRLRRRPATPVPHRRLGTRLRRAATPHRHLRMAVRLGRRRVGGRPILSRPPWAVLRAAQPEATWAPVWVARQPVASVVATSPRSRRWVPWSPLPTLGFFPVPLLAALTWRRGWWAGTRRRIPCPAVPLARWVLHLAA